MTGLTQVFHNSVDSGSDWLNTGERQESSGEQTQCSGRLFPAHAEVRTIHLRSQCSDSDVDHMTTPQALNQYLTSVTSATGELEQKHTTHPCFLLRV